VSNKEIFKKIVQVGIVVRDVEATARHYWEDVGIGPWQLYILDPSNTAALTLRSVPVSHAFRIAITMVGDVELELIEPLEGPNLYSEHLAAHGEGVHHLAFEVEDFQHSRDHLTRKGYVEIQSGRPFDVNTYAYFGTARNLACISELFSPTDAGKSFPPAHSTIP
jgi:methylmalonyl-CoA/ethylmalonyl-CoA epimerase